MHAGGLLAESSGASHVGGVSREAAVQRLGAASDLAYVK